MLEAIKAANIDISEESSKPTKVDSENAITKNEFLENKKLLESSSIHDRRKSVEFRDMTYWLDFCEEESQAIQ